MDRRITIPGELTLAGGLMLVSFAISLMVRAEFGISTISSLPFVLNNIFQEISFGTWNLIFQTCLLILLLAITRRFRTGYVISFFMSVSFGIILDFFISLLSGLPSDLWLGLLYFCISYPIMCLAIAMMVGSKIPLMIVDAFPNDLSIYFHVTYRRIKTMFDIVCLVLSVALSVAFLGNLVGVGIATVILAFVTGWGVQAAHRALSRVFIIKPWSNTLGKMAK
jgi:uncharacterized protein